MLKLSLIIFLAWLLLKLYTGIDEYHHRPDWHYYLSLWPFILLFLATLFVWLFPVLSTDPFSFINQKKETTFHFNFKKELFNVIQAEIPEISQYISNQMIKPELFAASKLFRQNYSDYNGDDYLNGRYKDVIFELCELHVFTLLRRNFDGIFVVCSFEKMFPAKVFTPGKTNSTADAMMLDFQEKYKATIKLSTQKNKLYLAINIKGYFFESDKLEMITKIDRDFAILKDIIEIVKALIDENQHLQWS